MKPRLSANVSLENPRISAQDAERQRRTAADILQRFDTQPGVILADEVGMGKTFVALAVAYSVVEAAGFQTQVVVMVPNSVRQKWPREWSVFRERCLPANAPIRASKETVNDAVSFLKKLDDPVDTRDHILFATHQALSGRLKDSYVRLAILSRVLRRKSLNKHREAFPRFARRLLSDVNFDDPEFVSALLRTSPLHWRSIVDDHFVEPLEDDPVPHAVLAAMDDIRFDELASALEDLPLRDSPSLDRRLADVRRAIAQQTQALWSEVLQRLDFELPLLVLDEAHHLKNPDTQLAQILTPGEDEEGASEKGALAGIFRRMLFLSATPFQLGSHELVEILHRFEGVRWESPAELEAYKQRVAAVDQALARAQVDGLRLDEAWGRLRAEDLLEAGAADWWEPALGVQLPDRAQRAGEALLRAQGSIRLAEAVLRPWVVRHRRPDREARRTCLAGRSILDNDCRSASGLTIQGDAVFPFLLAARAQALVTEEARRGGKRGSALFALGLASSFEAYRDTRRKKAAEVLDGDAGHRQVEGASAPSPALDWYLGHIDRALPDDDRDQWRVHPKIDATVRRAIEVWDRGEKIVIFCFYLATGRALRRHISRALEARLVERAAERMGADPTDKSAVLEQLQRISDNRFDRGAPLRKAVEQRVRQTLKLTGLPADWIDSDEATDREGFRDLIVRFVRTPSFLARFFDLRPEVDLVEMFERSYATVTFGEQTLEQQVLRFGKFLVERTEDERVELRDALASLQTGRITERHVDDDEETDREILMPNVRLVNGKTTHETRQTLLLAFNTPFFPEILVASSVMAEGVDLHLACRHVIHHDLDWNPSVLEQRTGRLDRIGSKSEVVGKPIQVYEPFVEATQDEKMYRVVKDRERWFNVVMGEGLVPDDYTADKAAARVPLPENLGASLSMDFSVADPARIEQEPQ